MKKRGTWCFFVLKIDDNIKNKGDGLKKYYLSQC